MLVALSLVLASYGAVEAFPRSPWGPLGGGFPFPGPYAGAYAGAGGGFWPFGGWFGPFTWPPIVWPEMPKPWYEGDNVCPETKISQEPDELKDWLKDEDMEFAAGDFSHQSKWCRGGNTKYMCMEKVTTNEGSKLIVTKYACCHGFVRPKDGSPGCVEDPSGTPSVAPPAARAESPFNSKQMQMNDKMKYSFLSSSSSGSSKRNGVDGVPAQ